VPPQLLSGLITSLGWFEVDDVVVEVGVRELELELELELEQVPKEA
jgi:hypothetical protein